MGVMSIVLPDDIETQFRELAKILKGPHHRGHLSETATEALLFFLYLHHHLHEDHQIPYNEVEDHLYKAIDCYMGYCITSQKDTHTKGNNTKKKK